MSIDLDNLFRPWEMDTGVFSPFYTHWVRKGKVDGAVYLHAYGEPASGGMCWNVTLTDHYNPTHLHSVNLPPYALLDEEVMKIADDEYQKLYSTTPTSSFSRLLDFEL